MQRQQTIPPLLGATLGREWRSHFRGADLWARQASVQAATRCNSESQRWQCTCGGHWGWLRQIGAKRLVVLLPALNCWPESYAAVKSHCGTLLWYINSSLHRVLLEFIIWRFTRDESPRLCLQRARSRHSAAGLARKVTRPVWRRSSTESGLADVTFTGPTVPLHELDI